MGRKSVYRAMAGIMVVTVFLSATSLVLGDESELKSVVADLAQRKQARSIREIGADIGRLDKALAKTNNAESGYEENFFTLLDIFIANKDEAAVRIGIDWEHYKNNVALVKHVYPADELASTLGSIALAKPEILKNILEDKNQVGHEYLIKFITRDLGSFPEGIKFPGFAEVKKASKKWVLDDKDRAALEGSLDALSKQQAGKK